MRLSRPTRLLCCLIGAAALAAGAAGADAIVTTDGSVIETRGPWEVRGKMVVFTAENGRLSSMRAMDVDFEATRRWKEAIAEGEETVAEIAPEPAKARIVITDADVSHNEALDEAFDVESPTADGEDGAQAAEPARSNVRVTAWDQDEPQDGQGRVIFGTVRNDGNSFATGITVEIAAYTDDGALIGTQEVAPVRNSLRPGESSTFSAQFTDAFSIGATRMTVESLELEIGAPEDAAGADDDLGFEDG